MRVGVLADTHDRLPAVAELTRRFQESAVGLVLHAGDYCSPFALRPFLDANIALAGVFGRNDGDREGLRAEASKGVGTELYESPHSVEVSGARILVVYDLGEVSERSITEHAIVIHGFTHQRQMRTTGDTLLLNPGEGCGWLYGVPSGAILDLETKAVEFVTLEGDWAR